MRNVRNRNQIFVQLSSVKLKLIQEQVENFKMPLVERSLRIERMSGQRPLAQQRQRPYGRAAGPRQHVREFGGVALEGLLRQEEVEGARNVADVLRAQPHQSRDLGLQHKRTVEPLRQEDGERGRDVPRVPRVLPPRLVRQSQSHLEMVIQTVNEANERQARA